MRENISSILNRIRNYFLEAFGFPGLNDYINLDSREVRKKLHSKMYYLNCQRLLAAMPIMFIINFLISLYAGAFHHSSDKIRFFYIFLSFLTIFALILGLITKLVKDLKHRPVLCRFLYLYFWMTYLLFFRTGIVIFNHSFYSGIWAVFMALFIALIPLLNDFESLCEVILLLVLVFTSDSHGLSNTAHVTIALIIIVALTQKFNYAMIVLRDYIQENTFYDKLTHLLNRKGAASQLDKCSYKFSKIRQKPISEFTYGIIMLDIDFFKKYNDTFGHDQGDICLESVATAIKHAVLGRSEVVIRHGGEEFVVILVDADKEETMRYAEKIRQSVLALEMPAPDTSVNQYVTVSVGIDVVDEIEDNQYTNVLSGADQALYKSKEKGRNQVTCYDPSN
ncbi:MAG: GGDEF domain-containing protein [Lachnospiraceae bacterium]|nr:GGDEF domain-containing protein [Lachnospiraceae bacterium]